MMFGHSAYLVYMLIFTLVPISILWLRNFSFLKRNLRIILITAFLGVVYQFVADPFAESWGAWFFTEEKIFGVWVFNFPLENTIFFALISVAISSAVLTFVRYQERGRFGRIFKIK